MLPSSLSFGVSSFDNIKVDAFPAPHGIALVRFDPPLPPF